MTLNDYQKQAMSFRVASANEMYALLGLSGEVGELHGYIAKVIRDDLDPDEAHLKKELGDILWFVAAIATDMEFSLDDIAAQNINKLESRKARNVIKGNGDNR